MNLSTFLSTIFDFASSYVPAWAKPFLPFLETAFQEILQSKPDASVAIMGDSPDSVKAGFTQILTDLVSKYVSNPIAKAILSKVITAEIGKLLDVLYNKYLASAVNVPTVPSVPSAPGITTASVPVTIPMDEAEFKAIVAAHLGITAAHCPCPKEECKGTCA